MYLIVVLGSYQSFVKEIMLSDKIYLNKPGSSTLRELRDENLSFRLIKY